MTNFILDTTLIPPISKNNPKQAVILCHGYGGDGADISMLAINWQRFLPDAIFLCPNAPEVCAVNPQGFQWFDLTSEKDEIILEKSLIAEKKLIRFLDEVSENYKIAFENMALVGFSQGCMISIQVALKKIDTVNCVIGYSGKIINQKHLVKNLNSKPKMFLMHGTNDNIVLPSHLLDSKEFLKNHGFKFKTKLFKNCDHKIPVEGISLGLGFLKENFKL